MTKINRQVALTFIINILIYGSGFLFLIISTRFLSKEEYGILSILLVTFTIIHQILTFYFSEFILKEISGNSIKKKIAILKGIYPFPQLLAICILIPLFFFKTTFLTFFSLNNSPIIFNLIILGLILKLLFIPLGEFYLSEKRVVLYKILMFSLNSLWMIITIIFALIFNKINLEIIFKIQVFSFLLSLMVSIYLFNKKYHYIPQFNIRFNFKLIKKVFKFSLPLMTQIVSVWIITASDRYILNYYHGSTSVASYSFIYSLLTFILSISLVILNVIYPYLADYIKTDKKAFNNLLNKGVKYSYFLIMPLIFGLFALDKELVTLISGNKYLNSVQILPFLLIFPLMLIGIKYMERLMILTDKSKQFAKINLSGMFLNIFLNFLFIPKWNFIGAAFATSLTYIYLFLRFFFTTRAILPKNIFKYNFKILFSSLIMFFLITFLTPQTIFSKIAVIIFGGIIYLIISYLLNIISKAEIKSFFKTF